VIRNRTVREALQFTAPRSSTDFHSFHRPPKKEKRSKKERNGCYYYRSNSPLTPEGEYYKGMSRGGVVQTVGKAESVGLRRVHVRWRHSPLKRGAARRRSRNGGGFQFNSTSRHPLKASRPREIFSRFYLRLLSPEGVKKPNGRDSLLRVRDGKLKHGRGAPRPYQIRYLRRPEFLSQLPFDKGDFQEDLP